MKAFKIIMIAALVSFTMMSIAQETNRAMPCKIIPLKVAISNASLCNAILLQLSPAELTTNERNALIVMPVIYKKHRYFISGTYAEWMKLFSSRIVTIHSEREHKEMFEDL